MIEYYSTVAENGRNYAIKVAKELHERGYEILGVSTETVMVPRGEGSDGKPVMVPGYQIIVDDGRPPLYKGYILDETFATVNENLQDPPGMKSKPAWLWD